MPTRFLHRPWGRALAVLFTVVLGCCVHGFRLFQHDTVDFRLGQDNRSAALTAKRDDLRQAISAVVERRRKAAAEIPGEEARAQQAEKIIAKLHALESTWDRLVGNPAQQTANAEQIKRLEAVRDAARARIAATRQELSRFTWEQDGLELELGRLDQAIAAVERDRSVTRHYLLLAWQGTRGWWILLFVLYLAVEIAVARRRRSKNGFTPT